MKLYVFAYYNKLLRAFDLPQFTREDSEHVAAMTSRGLMSIKDPKDIDRLQILDLYYLGTYDDVTGKFESLENKEYLLSCDQYLPKIILEDGRKEVGSQDGSQDGSEKKEA